MRAGVYVCVIWRDDHLTSPIEAPQYPRECLAGRRLRPPPRSKAPTLPMRVVDLQLLFPLSYPWRPCSRRTSLPPSRREQTGGRALSLTAFAARCSVGRLVLLELLFLLRTCVHGSWTLFDGLGTTLTLLQNKSMAGVDAVDSNFLCTSLAIKIDIRYY